MIILTGGAGFIGSCFLKKLNDENITDILVVDNLGFTNKWKNLTKKKFLNFINKNDFLLLLESNRFDNIDTIFHFGACSSTTEKNADYLFENNYHYSIRLAEYSVKNKIRFIYASSAATYGDGKFGYSDNTFDILEPMNCYGFTKHIFDQWVIRNKYDTIFVGLKFFNVFGPNEYHKNDMASMIYKSFLQITNTGKVKLFKSNSTDYKDGEQKRDFVYVKDCNEIIFNIYKNKKISGIFNLGTGKARTWNDLANAVFKALNLEPNIEFIDMPEDIKQQYQNFTEADITKLKNTMPNVKFQSLEQSIEDYVLNYLNKNFLIY